MTDLQVKNILFLKSCARPVSDVHNLLHWNDDG